MGCKDVEFACAFLPTVNTTNAEWDEDVQAHSVDHEANSWHAMGTFSIVHQFCTLGDGYSNSMMLATAQWMDQVWY